MDIKDLTLLVSAVGTILIGVLGLFFKYKLDLMTKKQDDNHKQFNGRMDEYLALTKSAAIKQGEKKEQDKQEKEDEK